MTRDEIEAAVLAVVKGQVSGEIEVELADDLVDDLDFDAIDHVEFALALEDRFGAYFSAEEEDAIVTVQDAVDLVAKNVPVNSGEKT